MKKFIKKIINSRKLLAFGAAAITTVALGSVVVSGFGENRPVREWSTQENGFDYVTFNSFTGVPNGIGDERDFLRGVATGRDAQWKDPVTNVTNEETVTAKVYIHNNANPDLNDAPGQPGVAKDVRVSIQVPNGLQSEHEVTSHIYASNAQPKVVTDTLDITSINDSLFQLTYVPGSAKMGGQTLSDTIFSSGVTLENQHGCFEYLREITFEMKVEKPGYQILKSARLKGETKDDWRKTVNAERGDTVEWRIAFANTGSTKLEDVTIVDDLPSFTEVVPGSVEVVNANNPSGYKYDSSAIQDNGDTVNVNIDDYLPGANAYLYLETKIEDHEDIQCGIHQITNVAYVTPYGLGTLNDNAKVNIINEACESQVSTTCSGLTAPALSLRKDESTVFTASANAEGTTIDSYEFKLNGTTVQNTASNTYNYTAANAGTHNVTVVVHFANGATETHDGCAKTVTVVEENDPFYACELFKLVRNDRKVTVTFKPVAENGATFKDATIVYTADGNKKHEELTNKVANGVVTSSYTFDKNAKNVFAKATVRFNVTADSSTVVKEVNCQAKAVLSSTTPPRELPRTGAGSIVTITLVATAAAGSIAHRKRTLANR